MQSRFQQVPAELGGGGSEHNGVVVAYGRIGLAVAGVTGSPMAAAGSFQLPVLRTLGEEHKVAIDFL